MNQKKIQELKKKSEQFVRWLPQLSYGPSGDADCDTDIYSGQNCIATCWQAGELGEYVSTFTPEIILELIELIERLSGEKEE